MLGRTQRKNDQTHAGSPVQTMQAVKNRPEKANS